MSVRVRTRNGASWIYVDFKGRRKVKRVGVGREGHRAALAAAEQIQARLTLGDLSPLHDAPVPEPVASRPTRTRGSRRTRARTCKFSTSRVYRTNLRRHVYPVIGATAISAVTRGDCRTLIAACRDRGLSPKSIENIRRTLSSLMTQAVEDGLLPGNPAMRARPPLSDHGAHRPSCQRGARSATLETTR